MALSPHKMMSRVDKIEYNANLLAVSYEMRVDDILGSCDINYSSSSSEIELQAPGNSFHSDTFEFAIKKLERKYREAGWRVALVIPNGSEIGPNDHFRFVLQN